MGASKLGILNKDEILNGENRCTNRFVNGVGATVNVANCFRWTLSLNRIRTLQEMNHLSRRLALSESKQKKQSVWSRRQSACSMTTMSPWYCDFFLSVTTRINEYQVIELHTHCSHIVGVAVACADKLMPVCTVLMPSI